MKTAVEVKSGAKVRVSKMFQNYREGSVLEVGRDLTDTLATFAVETGLAELIEEPKAKKAGGK